LVDGQRRAITPRAAIALVEALGPSELGELDIWSPFSGNAQLGLKGPCVLPLKFATRFSRDRSQFPTKSQNARLRRRPTWKMRRYAARASRLCHHDFSLVHN
jgi:hypothetical protein